MDLKGSINLLVGAVRNAIVARGPSFVCVWLAFGLLPVLTRMKPALIIVAMQGAGKETACVPQAK